MTCNCTCGCDSKADGSGPTPSLCMECGLTNSLNSMKHGLPYRPPPEIKLEPLERISDAQKDKALQAFVAENGF